MDSEFELLIGGGFFELVDFGDFIVVEVFIFDFFGGIFGLGVEVFFVMIMFGVFIYYIVDGFDFDMFVIEYIGMFIVLGVGEIEI